MSAFQNYLKDNNIYRFEGERGIGYLNTIAEELGYREDGFKYGSALERFLQDNPGAMQALADWIEENHEDGFGPWEEEDCPECGESESDCVCGEESGED